MSQMRKAEILILRKSAQAIAFCSKLRPKQNLMHFLGVTAIVVCK